jgi:hypothetical protein
MAFEEGFNIKDIAKPFKEIPKKLVPAVKVIPGKLKPVGQTIAHVGQTVGGTIVGAGKTVGKGFKLFGGGVWNFIKNVWKWARWIFWFVVLAFFVRYGLPVLRLVGRVVKGLFPKKA